MKALALFIDSGLRVAGCALFSCDVHGVYDKPRTDPSAKRIGENVTNGRVFRAWAAKEPGRARGAEGWRAMAETIKRDVDERILAHPTYGIGALHQIVIEEPQVYRGSKGKGDPDDLLQLAGVCGAIEGRFSFVQNVESVKPAEWKGQVDPDAMTARILTKPTPAELAVMEKSPKAKTWDHNEVDAVGLGLWWFDRL